jgi:hypothetical protein
VRASRVVQLRITNNFSQRGMVFLLTAYGKNEQANLTGAEKNAIARVIQEIGRAIEEGEIR